MDEIIEKPFYIGSDLLLDLTFPQPENITFEEFVTPIVLFGNTSNELNDLPAKGGFVADIFEDLLPKDYTMNLVNLQPRGLNNYRNKCFLNVTCQTLLYCPPFFEIISKLAFEDIDPKEYPILAMMTSLSRNFSEYKDDSIVSVLANVGSPFTPTCVYDLISKFNPNSSDLQEDMQEFFLFLIDELHEEFSKADKRNLVKEEVFVDDEWEQVGRGGRTSVKINDTASIEQSIIADIFRGEVSNIVKKKGLKSTLTVEPFFCLHLDITSENITSISDAISSFMTNERISDFQQGTIQASRESGISKLPMVLLLHLKRFAYINYKITKVQKYISFNSSLKIQSSWLLGDSIPKKSTYKLLSVVNHIGTSVQGGHYTCDILQSNGSWLRFDDAKVSKVSEEGVMQQNAYFLVYILWNQ